MVLLKFQLDSLSKKELFKDVFIRLINGSEITLNFFELRSGEVKIPLHDHPVEHLVIVLEGEIEFIIEEQKSILKEGECLFLQAETKHTARVLRSPVWALEIYPKTEDKYYKESE